MDSVLTGFLPIWAVTALGWLAGRFDLLGENAQSVRLPPMVTSPLQMLGGAAVPSALFALGLSLHTRTRPSPSAGANSPSTSGGFEALSWT